jgi:hypothetical protein
MKIAKKLKNLITGKIEVGMVVMIIFYAAYNIFQINSVVTHIDKIEIKISSMEESILEHTKIISRFEGKLDSIK